MPTATKKRVARKTSPAKAKNGSVDPASEAAQNIVDAVKSGVLDGFLEQFDDAVTERINARQAEEEKQSRAAARTKSASGEKKVAPPPRKPSASKAAAQVKPEKGVVYRVTSAFKRLAGADVEFVRLKADDTTRAVVSMVSDVPGFPKGKRVSVPVNALEAKPKTAAKSASRKVKKK